MTNADRLNAMSVEEKAEFLRNIRFRHGGCPRGVCDYAERRDYSCYQCWLDWLKQEVKDED